MNNHSRQQVTMESRFSKTLVVGARNWQCASFLNLLEEVLGMINLTFISFHNLRNSKDVINCPVSLR